MSRRSLSFIFLKIALDTVMSVDGLTIFVGVAILFRVGLGTISSVLRLISVIKSCASSDSKSSGSFLRLRLQRQ